MNSTASSKGRSAAAGLVGFLRELAVLAIVVVAIITFLAKSFDIPSSSMLPGLLVGDRVVGLKFAYGYSRYSLPFSPNLFSGRIFASEPERGEVAVFRLPSDPKVDYIKRVIGLPGDRIQVKGGELFINGKQVARRALETVGVDDMGHRRTYRRYAETLPNGRSYTIYRSVDRDWPGNNTPEYVVPPGHYFMLGDNRDNSCDSRFGAAFNPAGYCAKSMGYVPFENLVARASFILFSTDGSAGLWEIWKWPAALRLARLFKGVR